MFRTHLFRFAATVLVASLAYATPAIAQEAKQPLTAGESPKNDAATTYEMLKLFGDVFERVREDYVEETDETQLVENAINGMLTSLDPHSSYLSEKGFREMQVQTRGEFGGLGIEVTMENGLVKVVSPIDDTPAFKAGIKSGDFISHIDGEAVMGMNLAQAVEKMRGAVNTKVKLTILRVGMPEPMEIELTRAIIKIRSVRSRLEDGNIGYVRVTSFSELTAQNMVKAIEELKTQSKGLKGLVLDLRNNPGGLLDQAIDVSDAFLDHGEVVSTRGRQPADIKRYNARAGEILDGAPIVVLINGGSASASEIVAGALQDHKRAVVMGTKSFGKGSVQTVIPLPGHGAMRLTTSRYYTPSGRSIQAKGIEPDIIVEPAKVEQLAEGKGMSEADLRGALMNEEDSSSKPVNNVLPETPPANPSTPQNNTLPLPANDNKAPGEATKEEEESAKDYQLSRALDLLRGLTLYREAAGTSGKK
jgi:carboxyl-terminal processing protease